MNTFKKAILFDMDGVVLDSEKLYTKAEIKLFGEYGVEIPEEDWALFRGCSENEFFDKSMKRYNIKEDKAVFMKKGREYVKREFEKNLNYMPGFKNLHNMVITNYKTALVTASPQHNLNWVRTIIDLDYYFENILSGEETAKNKPHPEPYLEMMSRLNVKPSNTIIIEDSLNGIHAGLKSGAFVIAKTGSIPKDELSIAHKIVSSLNQITKSLIEGLLQK